MKKLSNDQNKKLPDYVEQGDPDYLIIKRGNKIIQGPKTKSKDNKKHS